jgi:hypothetical protein
MRYPPATGVALEMLSCTRTFAETNEPFVWIVGRAATAIRPGRRSLSMPPSVKIATT